MNAGVLSIGDELMVGQTVDTNGPWLSSALAALGVTTIERRAVGDDRRAIAAAIGDLIGVADLVICTGGIGPTADDLTRIALGDVTDPGTELVEDAEALAQIRVWFEGRGRVMPPGNTSQAMRPASMRMLQNRHGTAPGIGGTHAATEIFVLPGPPREMKAMFAEHVQPTLVGDGRVVVTEAVHEFGLGESVAAGHLGDLMSRTRDPQVGTTAGHSVVSARVRSVASAGEAASVLEPTVREIERAWEPYAYGRGATTLAEVVGDLLRSAGLTLATAESCTGGWLGKSIVDVPGSSAYYAGGWVCYSNEMKHREVGVPNEMIEQHGAVSGDVARALADGARDRGGADVGVGITGIAGPHGATDGKPVGTVFIGLSAKRNGESYVESRHFEFTGDREIVRWRTVLAALQMVRFELLGLHPGPRIIWQIDRPSRGGAPS